MLTLRGPARVLKLDPDQVHRVGKSSTLTSTELAGSRRPRDGSRAPTMVLGVGKLFGRSGRGLCSGPVEGGEPAFHLESLELDHP